MTRMAIFLRPNRATRFVVALSLVVLMHPGTGQAQTTDITSSGLGTAISSNGTTTFIDGGTRPETGGVQPNLFHSFGNFSVGAGDTALFRNLDATGAGGFSGTTDNIFGRVTGGNVSNIFGKIDTVTGFPEANFWLINPAGVVFGPNASLNVGGDTNIAVADYLKHTGGSQFFADPLQPITLSIDPIQSFGFLKSPTGPLALQGTRLSRLGPLNSVINLVGGDISITPEVVAGAQQNPIILASDGRINLIAVRSAGEVVLGNDSFLNDPQLVGFEQMGTITLTNATLQVTPTTPSGFNSGTVFIRGGKVVFSGGAIFANFIPQELGPYTGIGKVTIQGGEGLSDGVTLSGTRISAQNFGTGPAGVGSSTTPPVSISGRSVQFLNGAGILSSNNNEQTAGSITISATDLVKLSGAGTSLISNANSSGPAGDITISASRILIEDGAKISTDTSGDIRFRMTGQNTGFLEGGGKAGDIRLNVDVLDITTAGRVSSTTSAIGLPTEPTLSTTRGSITIGGYTAPSATRVSISGAGSGLFTESTGNQLGGNITIQTHELAMTNGGLISARTASNAATADGGAINITIPVSSLIPNNQLLLNSGASITTSSLAQLTASSPVTTASGDAGFISLSAPTITLNGPATKIAAITEGIGNAGLVTLNVNELTMNNLSQIVGSSESQNSTAGIAGRINIRGGPTADGTGNIPSSRITLDNSTINTTIDGGISSTTPATIDITAQTVNLTNGAEIKADTSGAARAGDIAFNVGTLRANMNPDGTPIPSAVGVLIRSASNQLSSSAGPAGTVTVSGPGAEPTDAATLVTLSRTTLSTEVTGSRADKPGTISITADTVVLQDQTLIFSNTGSGSGGVESFESVTPAGNIFLNVDTLRAHNNVFITSSSVGEFDVINGTPLPKSYINLGDAGTITIRGITAGSAATAVTFANMELRTAGSGGTQPGNITLRADVLDLREGAFRADTFGTAPAGTITLQVDTLKTDSATITSRSGFETNIININAPGRAGAITIEGIASPADTITLTNTKVTTEAGTEGAAGGPITITGTTVDLGGTLITANTAGAANAGTITFNAGTLTLNDTFVTSSSTSTETNAGNAGSVTMTATGSFTSSVSTVATSAQQGAGGTVSIAAGDMRLTGGTTISAESEGSEDSGSIALTSATDLLMRNSKVTTFAAQASGGNIKLTAPNIIRLVDSTLTSSVQGQAGSNGGNINIDPLLVVIQNSRLLANANAGAGGSISIDASGAVLVDPNSLIDASAGPAGVSGSVNINAPIQVLSGALVPLNLVYSQAGLSGDQCAADPKGQFSSFVQTGRDGVPQVPGALSPSPLSFMELLRSGSLGTSVPNVAAARLGLDFVTDHDSTQFRFHSACRS